MCCLGLSQAASRTCQQRRSARELGAELGGPVAIKLHIAVTLNLSLGCELESLDFCHIGEDADESNA